MRAISVWKWAHFHRRRVPPHRRKPLRGASFIENSSAVFVHYFRNPPEKAGCAAWDSSHPRKGPLATSDGRQWGFSCQSAPRACCQWVLGLVLGTRAVCHGAGGRRRARAPEETRQAMLGPCQCSASIGLGRGPRPAGARPAAAPGGHVMPLEGRAGLVGTGRIGGGRSRAQPPTPRPGRSATDLQAAPA